MAGELLVCDLGVIEYRACLALQEDLRDRVAAGAAPEVLLLLEHPPVYTLGRRSGPEDLPLGEAFYRERGIDVVHVNRGGKLTFHNRGQLVGYPIMRTDDILGFLRTMEAALIAALTPPGVPGEAGGARPGVGPGPQDRVDRRPRHARDDRPTASRSTSTTTWSRSPGPSRAACPTCG